MKGAQRIRWYRTFRTAQEMRKYYDSVDQGVTPRASRNPLHLPDAWDDYPATWQYDKSWKTYRKTQHCEENRNICRYCEHWYPYTEKRNVGGCNTWKLGAGMHQIYKYESWVRYNENCEMFEKRKS